MTKTLSQILLRTKKNKTGCLVWQGSINKSTGYGTFFSKNNGKSNYEYAHRAVYKAKTGEDIRGLMVCHKCDNPPCCNPDHLFSGNQKDNMHDCMLKGRTKNGTTKLSISDVRMIRRIYSTRQFLQREIAKRFGVHRAEVCMIINFKRWSKIK